MKILITGAEGFIGKNLYATLKRKEGVELLPFDLSSDPNSLPALIDCADFIVHLAGVNRPIDSAEFMKGNFGLSSIIVDYLEKSNKRTPVLFASSIQAELDNEYGKSKRAAEERLNLYSEKTGAVVRVFRFANVFGKWCRPNYNSAAATFCYNIAHGIPIAIRDPQAPINLIYIDDVVAALIQEIEGLHTLKGFGFSEAGPVYSLTVGELASKIQLLHEGRLSGMIPDLSIGLIKKLNSTYLSYLEPAVLSLAANMKKDERGWLFELIKSEQCGQIFVSTTKPGKCRGNHFHDTKVEKFCVVSGKARISLRRIDGSERVDFEVDGEYIRIVDIPPGFTHSIENTGGGDCVTIFWANEIFNAVRPDTYFLEV